MFYYSATGNTKKACEHLHRKIPDLELIDMAQPRKKMIFDFDMVGFAFPVQYLELPPVVRFFLELLPLANGKPAFLLSTFGIMGGKALRSASKELQKKGYYILDFFALRMPESFPPFIAKGVTGNDAPTPAEVAAFNAFCDSIGEGVRRLGTGKAISPKKVKLGFWDAVIPAPRRSKIMRQFGTLSVHEGLCAACFSCRDACPYGAIFAHGKPEFDMSRCRACFACLNTCPNGAISVSGGPSLPQYKSNAGMIEEKFK